MAQPRIHFSGADVLERNDRELLTTRVDGELVGMSLEQGACYGLDAIGTRIWDLLAEPRSLDDLCAQLVREYDVADQECRTNVIALLDDLRREDLLRVNGA